MNKKRKNEVKKDLYRILQNDMGHLSTALNISLNGAEYLANVLNDKLAELQRWDGD